MRSSDQAVESIAPEAQKCACFGRIEMPWENLQVAADRGLLFTGLKRHDSSLGYVSALVMVSDGLCEDLCDDQRAGLMNLHCREGEDLYRIPTDLSQRSDAELASDEIFCEWQIAVRDGFREKTGNQLRNQEAARWNFRIIKSEPKELAYFVAALVRIKTEIASRTNV